MTRFFAFLLVIFPVGVMAQSLRERVEAGTHISQTEWYDLTIGKTVIYQSFGLESGREYYPPSGNTIFYQTIVGTCMEGTYSYDAPSFCFQWQGNDLACFDQKWVENEIYIISKQNGGIHFVADIIEAPFRCAPALLSALDPLIAIGD